MKLVIEIPDSFVQGLGALGFDEQQAGILIRDALGEFVSTRSPAGDYVDRRYRDHGSRFRHDKVSEVVKRNAWATVVKAGVIKLEE